jgi:serine protease Do
MKGKYLAGALLMAFLGASIALFVYTRVVGEPSTSVTKDSSNVEVQQARAFLTSMQTQEGPVDFTFAAEQTVHGVVHVHTKSTMSGQSDNPFLDYFYGNRNRRPQEVQGYGSGVIISPDGYIITNNHVVENSESIEVILSDNRTFTAKIIGRDPASDIALIKISAENLPFIKYGDSDLLKVGEWVLAVGNPFNLTSTVTAGIVSAKGRSLSDPDGTNPYRIESFIQTDAALNMGNSGGALVNTKGLLVGITSMIMSRSGDFAGNSFAIPVSIVKKVVDDLKEFGEVQRALIGVNIKDVESADADKQNLKEVKGVLVTNVVTDGSAADAGIKENDVIVKFNGVTVNSVSELQEQVGRRRPGDKATVTYMRSGKESTAEIVMKNASGTTKVVTPGMGDVVVYGAKFESLAPRDMRSYNVDYGVRVTDVSNGRFKDIGIKRGDIILSLNGKKVKNPADVNQFTNNGTTLKSIVGIQSDGTGFTLQYGN